METKGYPTVTHKTPKTWLSVIGLILLLFGLPAASFAQTYTVAPPPFLTELNDSGAIVVGGCIWTYAAGTTNAIATYSNNTGTTNSNPIIADAAGRFTAYLLAGTNYKFVYEQACTPPAHGAVLRTADNVAGVPGAAATVDITCTAGETISAGLAVYVSDGSGSKTPGQCYKADSANAYSSVSANVLGIAPAAITSGASGTVRLAGSVTGLSSLSVGSAYFVGTAGAITTTAPATTRKIGAADTATSLILQVQAPPNTDNGIDDFRLTLTTGTPVTSADVTAATTIYATPAGLGNRLALYDSTGIPTVLTSAEFSIAVPATTSTMYDIFAFNNNGVAALELLAWTNDTTRATAIVLTTTGTYTKSGDLTRRYLGSFRTTTVAGQTEDSLTKRYLWNYYNRVYRPLLRLETTATWAYTTATIRQANGAAANQVEAIIGVQEIPVRVVLNALVTNTGGTIIAAGIGLDSTTTFIQGGGMAISVAAGFQSQVHADVMSYPGIGRHFFSWNEYSTAAGTSTWSGLNATLTGVTMGLTGGIEG